MYAQVPPTQFRVGEKIAYSVSFNKFDDVAYAEIYAASRGTISGRDAIELTSKIKTLNFFSAAFYTVDETRTTFAAADTGMPLYSRKTEYLGGVPREKRWDYLKSPAVNHDLLTLIYKIRYSGTGGSTLFERDKIYNVTFQQTLAERVATPAGEYDTNVISVQSDFLNEIGIKDLRINITSDEARIPVLVRIKTVKGEFRAEASSIQIVPTEVEVAPTPFAVATPTPTPTPKPVRTPEPYVDNMPIAPELAFQIGESLEYRVTAGGRPVGSFVLRAQERKQINGTDTLVLAATVTNAEAGNPLFNLGDTVVAHADPETLAPRQIDIKFLGGLNFLNQTAIFDAKTGSVSFKGANRVDAPIGTHSILTLLYAMRSFNLKPSKDLNNPVNDTRVAVFWDAQPYIFTLRPAMAETMMLQGEAVSSQLVSINTGNPQLDQLSLKLWLSNDERRLPIRFSAGSYQADLVAVTNIPLK